MVAMVVTASGALSSEKARELDLPVLLFQGGIHAGEIDGKDAGFWALRDLLEKDDPLLRKVVLVFVPVFNVDGHERFGAWNRPNQNGPREMGWRVTSQNLNLNRDYAKADSVEMRAMLALLRAWDPILYVDLHATDGAQFQPDIALMVEPRFAGDPVLMPATRKMQLETVERLKAQGSMPLDFYPSFRDYEKPASGFSLSANTPRFSTGYWPLHNRMAMLVETHSWKGYPTRVRITRNTVLELARQTAEHGREWKKLAHQADQAASKLAGKPVALSFKTDESQGKEISYPGYAYTMVDSAISGAPVVVYDTSTPQDWKVPYFDRVVPNLVVKAPGAGYLVPAGQAELVRDKLDTHGVRYSVLEKGLAESPVQVFRAGEFTPSPRPVEGRTTATFRGEWSSEPHSLPPGSLFVPIDQPAARLAMTLLEPQAPDSLAGWGFFNAHFEQKEYMEEYVVEDVAKEMMKVNPALKVEFETKLREDAAFAADPNARRDFFYRRHPAWDSRFGLYPVYRTDTSPVLKR